MKVLLYCVFCFGVNISMFKREYTELLIANFDEILHNCRVAKSIREKKDSWGIPIEFVISIDIFG